MVGEGEEEGNAHQLLSFLDQMNITEVMVIWRTDLESAFFSLCIHTRYIHLGSIASTFCIKEIKCDCKFL